MSWQAILDDNNIVVTVNNWDTVVGIPCPQETPLGYLWNGSEFVPNPADVRNGLESGVQQYMDTTVQTRGYDNILSCCSYISSSVAQFASEGQAAVAWRDAVWNTCFSILDDAFAGLRPVPTLDELIAELPAIGW